MKKITESQLRILERLHDYRFLTVRQMVKMGIASQHTVYKSVSSLHKGGKKYIDWVDFGTRPERGRIDRFIYLTKHGAELLAEALQYPISKINYPKGKVPSYRDFDHRRQTIDLHILARTHCETKGGEMVFYQTYFEHMGGNNHQDPNKPKRRAVNTIKVSDAIEFIPDAIFKMIAPNGKPYLFTAEIYRNHNTKRTHNQLFNHLKAIEHGTISKLYSYARGVPVLIICDTKGAMQALQSRLKNDPAFQNVEDYFLFRLCATEEKESSSQKEPKDAGNNTRKKIKTLLDGGFSEGWKTYTGKSLNLLQD